MNYENKDCKYRGGPVAALLSVSGCGGPSPGSVRFRGGHSARGLMVSCIQQ
jgi:hypothetical protein